MHNCIARGEWAAIQSQRDLPTRSPDESHSQYFNWLVDETGSWDLLIIKTRVQSSSCGLCFLGIFDFFVYLRLGINFESWNERW